MAFIVPNSWAQSASPEASEQITEAPDDSTHLKHIIELNRLGNLYSEQSDYAQAEDYYLQALEEARTCLGEEHAYYGKVADNLGHLYIDLGEYSKAGNFADIAGNFVLNAKGEPCFNFGKHKGKTVTEVFEKEPNYYAWIMDGQFAQSTKHFVTKIKLQMGSHK